jgi:hypothetical protein
MSGVGTFSAVSTRYGNGPGQTTKGFDIQASYGLPLGPGDLDVNVTATRVTELRTGPTTLDGVTISTGDDRLGTLNFATFAQAAPKWRANLGVNYGLGRQNFRLGVNFVSAVKDERAGVQYGEDGENWVTTDFTYRLQTGRRHGPDRDGGQHLRPRSAAGPGGVRLRPVDRQPAGPDVRDRLQEIVLVSFLPRGGRFSPSAHFLFPDDIGDKEEEHAQARGAGRRTSRHSGWRKRLGLVFSPSLVAAAGKAKSKRPAPPGFLWGTAISAYQSEGGNTNSDAWLMENLQPSMFKERSGDACDSYHRYAEDFAIAGGLGFNCYRLGVEWARIEPSEGFVLRSRTRPLRPDAGGLPRARASSRW